MPAQNTPPADYPQAVRQQIALLAQNIVIARKRRRETQAQWAQRLGVSQPTMARIERGDPSVSMASYVMCMWLINQAQGLADLIAPQNDLASLEREVARTRAPARARAKASTGTPMPAAQPKGPQGEPAIGARTAAKVPAPVGDADSSATPLAGQAFHGVSEPAPGPFVSTGPTRTAVAAPAPPGAATRGPARTANRTAAGLAALVSGSRKARP